MSKRWDVSTPTERESKDGGEKKTYWNRCGVAFEGRSGSINIILDTLPINGRLSLFEPKPRDGAGSGGGPSRAPSGGGGGGGFDGGDDGIPFIADAIDFGWDKP